MMKWSLKDIAPDKLGLVVVVVGLAMAAYHLVSSQVYLLDSIPHLNTHLGFCLLLVFLGAAQKGTTRVGKTIALILAGAVVVAAGYVQIFWMDLVERAYFNTDLDLVIGVMLILLVLEATRRDFGLILPVLTLAVVLYPIIGQHMPEPFKCSSMDLRQTISNLSIGLQNGIYGIVLPTSANYIFLFVLFGGVLQALGGTEFFMLLSRRIAGGMQGGPGMMAVVSSSVVGSITGSAAANVAITGSFTIPLMKKVGYKPEHAGAIEAAASNGGQIMPPVMGIVAFGMAGITGIPYLKIITMALVPALLYFWAAGLYVYLRAGQLKIGRMEDRSVPLGRLLASLPVFVSPFVVIMFLLIRGHSVMFVAFWAIITTMVVSLLRRNRPSVKQFIEGFVQGARAGAGIGASAACVGLIMATVTMSGLGVKLAAGIQAWSGGILIISLIIIAVICVVMGCGGPSLTAYFIVSMFAVPAVMKMGVPLEIAHFYTMYFAVFAFLTPPVALVALIAARLAQADYIRTAIESTKAAIGGFLIPFMFVYCPILLLQPTPWARAVTGIVASVLCLLALEIAFVGFFLVRCNLVTRIMAGVAGLALLTSIIRSSYLLLAVGLVVLGAMVVWQLARKREETARTAVGAT
jgi:TRAP transporter 4TM/12TM fusion protein